MQLNYHLIENQKAGSSQIQMDVLVWTLQISLAAHTAAGAVWKVKHSERAMPGLDALPHAAWQATIVCDVAAAVGLLLPAVGGKAFSWWAPASAALIAAEMVLFSALYMFGRTKAAGRRPLAPVYYWMGVAAFCSAIAYAR